MVPVSWEEMQCPQSGTIEKRKVARADIPVDVEVLTSLNL